MKLSRHFVAVLLLFLASACAAATPRYKVAQQLALDGDALRWDFAVVDEASQRLFYTRENEMGVLDIQSGQVVGSIKNLARVHGVALVPERGLGFVSAGAANTVTAFDLHTLQQKATIAVHGRNPDALLYEPISKKLYIFNHDSDSVDVLDVASLKVVSTIQASGHPEMAVSDGHGRVYFNIEDHPGIDVLEVAADRVVATWPLLRCEEPSGIDIDAEQGRLFSACANGEVVVTDAVNGKRIADFGIGDGADGLAFDLEARTIFVPSGRTGVLNMAVQVDRDHYKTMDGLSTAHGARTLALDALRHRIYLPTTIDKRFTILVVEPAS